MDDKVFLIATVLVSAILGTVLGWVLRGLKGSIDNEKDTDLSREKMIYELGESREKIKQLEENLGDKSKIEGTILEQIKQISKDNTNEEKENIRDLNNIFLKDLKEKYEKLHAIYTESLEEKGAIFNELGNVKKINSNLHEETKRLTTAFKRDVKFQGTRNEDDCQLFLEKAGLKQGVHFEREKFVKIDKNNNGRIDFLINLPDDKNIIIDAKISLNSWVDFSNSDSPDDLHAFLLNFKKHIDDLASKGYDKSEEINCPEFIILYTRIDSACNVVQNEMLKTKNGSINLFDYALEKNIIIVSMSTLLATLQVVSSIWRISTREESAQEIVKLGGEIFDKVNTFIDYLNDIIANVQNLNLNIKRAEANLVGKGGLVKKAKKLIEYGCTTNNKELKEINTEKLNKIMESDN